MLSSITPHKVEREKWSVGVRENDSAYLDIYDFELLSKVNTTKDVIFSNYKRKMLFLNIVCGYNEREKMKKTFPLKLLKYL